MTRSLVVEWLVHCAPTPQVRGSNHRLGKTDYLTEKSAHVPQGPRSRILSCAQYTLALMGCCATELSYTYDSAAQ
ncbi:hypothetical protein TNCV_134321 [Trichonephila clavipes]|nr:hypothetical protein TNCV_134321 [Trichonephila clavipes]